MISIFGRSNSGILNGLKGISSWTYDRPTVYLLRSHLKILKPFILNCLFGNVCLNLGSQIKKYIEIFNECGKHFIYNWKGSNMKVTYYYSIWIPQTLIFDVSEVTTWLFKFIFVMLLIGYLFFVNCKRLNYG